MKHYQAIEIKYMGWHNPSKTNRIRIKDMRFKKNIFIESVTGNTITDAEKFLKNRGFELFGYSSNNANNTYTIFVKDINGGFSEVLK